MVQRRVQEASEQGQAALLIEEKFMRVDGRVIDVEVANIPSTYQGAPAIQVVVREITGRKQAEAEIAQLNRDLERRAAELESANRELEAFSYSVSHDLRTPVAGIEQLARQLLQDYPTELTPAVQRTVQLIHDNTHATDDLIQGLLGFSRTSRQPLTKQTVCMADLVEVVWDTLIAAYSGRRVELVLGDLPDGEADPILLKQVWTNLISNALKFTGKREIAQIEIGSYRQDDKTIYYVKDNGVGFDMTHADQLFGVFRRLHAEDEYAGTGVGLAIVERIVRRHGGRIWVQAQVDQGATFFFTLA